MYPELIATYGVAVGVAETATVSVPNVLVDDWIVATHGLVYDTASTGAPTGTGSGNWVAIGSRVGDAVSNVNFDSRHWRKTALGTGTYTVSVSGESESILIVLHVRGAMAMSGTPTENEAGQTVGTTSLVIPSLTTVDAETLMVSTCGGITFSGAISMTPPSGMTEVREVAVGNIATLSVATQQVATASSTGTRTFTANRAPTHGWSGKTFAISGDTAPAASAPTVNAGADTTTIVNTVFERTPSESANGAAVTSRAWTIVSGPAGAGSTIGTAQTLSWTPTTVGSYVLRYSATNPVGTGTDDVAVQVNNVSAAGQEPGRFLLV